MQQGRQARDDPEESVGDGDEQHECKQLGHHVMCPEETLVPELPVSCDPGKVREPLFGVRNDHGSVPDDIQDIDGRNDQQKGEHFLTCRGRHCESNAEHDGNCLDSGAGKDDLDPEAVPDHHIPRIHPCFEPERPDQPERLPDHHRDQPVTERGVGKRGIDEECDRCRPRQLLYGRCRLQEDILS